LTCSDKDTKVASIASLNCIVGAAVQEITISPLISYT